MRKLTALLVTLITSIITPCIAQDLEKATFGAGCFWCTETIFEQLKGVESVSSGYTGGNKVDPTYKEVCTGRTGHAEVTMIQFNPEIISYSSLLEIFWEIHDPTTLNSQGPDFGTQYRSEIFYLNNQQKDIAENIIKSINKKLSGKVVTKFSVVKNYCPAEEYHQRYLEKR